MRTVTSEASDLLQAALALPVGDRAGVAAVLLASLDGADPDAQSVEDAWAAELQVRADQVITGQSTGERWEDVRDGVARRLSEQ